MKEKKTTLELVMTNHFNELTTRVVSINLEELDDVLRDTMNTRRYKQIKVTYVDWVKNDALLQKLTDQAQD